MKRDTAGTMHSASAAAILEEQFPQLAPLSVTAIGEGCDNVAVEVNAEWVFRFPKSAAVEEKLAIETRVLPALAKRLPIAVPEFCFHGRPSSSFQRRFAGYRKLPGVRAIKLPPPSFVGSPLAPALGRALSALHAFPLDDARSAGVPDQDIAETIDELRVEALDDFEIVARIATDAPLERWRDFLLAGVEAADAREPAIRALVHNDLAAEHVLVDPSMQSITGIIDWSDMSISDPAADFAGLFHWGGELFVEAVLSRYNRTLDATARGRARFMAACRGVADVKFGVETNRNEYVAAGLRALTMCARPPAVR